MTERLYLRLQSLVLVLLGIFLLNKVLNGTVFWYINARFLPLTLVGAVGLVWLARVMLRGDRHAHGGRSLRPLVVLAIPILLGLFIPAEPLGASAVANKGLSLAPVSAASSEAPLQLELASTDRTVLDWLQAFNQSENPHSFDGQQAEVVGFVYHDPRLPEGQFLLGRFTLTCCVADASAIGLIVEWPEAEDLPDNAWVQASGPIEVGELDGNALPMILAHSVLLVPEPAQPYLYN